MRITRLLPIMVCILLVNSVIATSTLAGATDTSKVLDKQVDKMSSKLVVKPDEHPLPNSLEIVVDYGYFVLAEGTNASFRKAENNGANILERELDKIHLKRKTIQVEENNLLRLSNKKREGYYLLKTIGPIKQEWVEKINHFGKVIRYIPDYTYLVKLDSDNIEKINEEDFVKWIGDYKSKYKISKGLNNEEGKIQVKIYSFNNVSELVEKVSKLGKINSISNKSFQAKIDSSYIDDIANLKNTHRIEKYQDKNTSSKMNDNASWVSQTGKRNLRTIWQEGITGEGQVIGTADDGINLNHQQFKDSQNRVGPWHRKIINYTGYKDAPLHGTHTASILAGNDGGNNEYDGMAKNAKLSVFDIFQGDAESWDLPGVSWDDIYKSAYNDGAKIYSLSLGDRYKDDDGYASLTQRTDRFAWDYKDMLFFASNGNLGIDDGDIYDKTTVAPADGRNVVGVGACGNNGDSDDISKDDIPDYSSRGGNKDYNEKVRLKPDIVAPAHRLYSASHEGEKSYNYFDHTSAACPVAAASGALIREYFVDGHYPKKRHPEGLISNPSAALIKAVLINGASPIDGDGTHQNPYDPQYLNGDMNYPNWDQGWGRINLTNSLEFLGDSRHLKVHDVKGEDSIKKTGDNRTYHVYVDDPSKPLEITMDYTDYVKRHWNSPDYDLINQLNLKVRGPDGDIYHGNVLKDNTSKNCPDGPYDNINTLENVIINNPKKGLYTIDVWAENIPNPDQDQPFALAITGGFRENFASFDYSPSDPYAGEEIQFTDTSYYPNPEHSPFRCDWDFGDGNETTDTLNPTHAYSEMGTYNVTLTATFNDTYHGEGVTDKTSREIEVKFNDPPDADFNYWPTNPQVGEQVQFWNQSSDLENDIESWVWVFGDGDGGISGTSQEQDPTFTFSSLGTHDVQLTVTDAGGKQDTITKTIDVVDTYDPIVNILSPGDGTTIYSFSATVQWDGRDHQSGIDHYETKRDDDDWWYTTDTSRTYYSFSDGSHTVQVKAVDEAGNTDTDSVTFNIDTTPEITDSTHPEGTWTTNNDPSFDWRKISGSDVEYHYELDHTSNTGPYGDPSKSSSHKTFSNVNDGEWYFHVRAKNEGADWGTTAHYGPVKIDTTPPSVSVPKEADSEGDPDKDYDQNGTFTVYWSGSDDGSGIQKYRLQESTDAGQTWSDISLSSDLSTSKTVEGVNGKTYYYRVKAIDSLGHETSWSISDGITVDTQAPQLIENLYSELGDFNPEHVEDKTADSYDIVFGGSVFGSLSDTYTDDGSYHRVEEGWTGGGSLRAQKSSDYQPTVYPPEYYDLEMKYTVPLSSRGTSFDLYMNAFTSGENFEVSYSVPGDSTRYSMFQISQTSDGGYTHSSMNASILQGHNKVQIWIEDTVASTESGMDETRDTISIDHLYIGEEIPAYYPVNLTWDDSPSGDVDHYNIYRSTSFDSGYTLIDTVDYDADSDPIWTDVEAGYIGETNDYYYAVGAVDDAGNLAINNHEIATKYNLDLHDGWNFISLPAEPKDTQVEEVMKTIIDESDLNDSALDEAEYYNDSVHLSYMPGRKPKFNDFDNIDQKMGAWLQLKMNRASTMMVTGRINEYETIHLTGQSQGYWNMVGYPSMTAGNNNLPDEVETVGYYDASQEYNISYDHSPGDFTFETGQGYFLEVTEDTQWNIQDTMPDFSAMASNIELSSNDLNEGDSLSFETPIFNTGYDTIKDLQVRAYATSKKVFIGNRTISALPPKSRVNLTFNWTDIPAGRHKIHVVIDRDNNVSNGYLSASTRPIQINHKPRPDFDIYRNVNVTLRVAGRKGNEVTCLIYENGAPVKSISETRTAGKPDSVTEPLRVYEDRNYTMELVYNATHRGANPTWVRSESSEDSEKIKVTFKTKDGFDQKVNYSLDEVLSESLEGVTHYHFSALNSYDPDGEIVSYQWDFGDGNSATGVDVDHEYSESGEYIITLTVTDDEGAVSTVEYKLTVREVKGKPYRMIR